MQAYGAGFSHGTCFTTGYPVRAFYSEEDAQPHFGWLFLRQGELAFSISLFSGFPETSSGDGCLLCLLDGKTVETLTLYLERVYLFYHVAFPFQHQTNRQASNSGINAGDELEVVLTGGKCYAVVLPMELPSLPTPTCYGAGFLAEELNY